MKKNSSKQRMEKNSKPGREVPAAGQAAPEDAQTPAAALGNQHPHGSRSSHPRAPALAALGRTWRLFSVHLHPAGGRPHPGRVQRRDLNVRRIPRTDICVHVDTTCLGPDKSHLIDTEKGADKRPSGAGERRTMLGRRYHAQGWGIEAGRGEQGGF